MENTTFHMRVCHVPLELFVQFVSNSSCLTFHQTVLLTSEGAV